MRVNFRWIDIIAAFATVVASMFVWAAIRLWSSGELTTGGALVVALVAAVSLCLWLIADRSKRAAPPAHPHWWEL